MTTLIDIRLPHMGSVERAVITTWHKGTGDKVAVDDPLLEVSTDKVETEIPCPYEGTLVQILAQPEQEVPVGELIARLAPVGASDEEVAAALGGDAEGPATAAAPASFPGSTPSSPGDIAARVESVPAALPAAAPAAVLAPRQDLDRLSLVLRDGLQHVAETGAIDSEVPSSSPLVRRLAKEAGIDLRAVRGTGLGGRITRADVLVHRDGGSTPPVPTAPTTLVPPVVDNRPQVTQATASTGPVTAAPATTGPRTAARPEGYEALPCEEVALTPVRKAIAAHMVASVSTAPQLTAQVDVDFSRLTAARAEVNAERARQGQGKLSYLPFIARALVAVIGEHPDINATFTDTHLLRWRTVNLGVAVDADAGLYVPVVRDAQRLSLDGMGEAIEDLARRARERRLTATDLQGGTITISNSGSVGGVISTPILTRPQVASLGVPAVIRQPVAVTAENGEEYVAIRPVARLGLTFDHRAMDGSTTLRALMALQRALQNWPAEAYR